MFRSQVDVWDVESDDGIEYFVSRHNEDYNNQPSDNISSLLPEPTEVKFLEGEDQEDHMSADQTIVQSDSSNRETSHFILSEKKDAFIVNDQNEDLHALDYLVRDELPDEANHAACEAKKTCNTKHMRFKKHKPILTCSTCSYTNERRYLLLRHMKTHLQIHPYFCPICERGFKSIVSLQNHINMHDGHKPYACKHCSDAFASSGELVRHLRYKHTIEKPHKCHECGITFVERSKLRRHIRSHTGERPYQCPHCAYAASHPFSLNRHLRTHTGDKPYKCNICDKRFTQASTLKTHQNVHDVTKKQVFACEFCPVKCCRKTDLRKHIQNLHSTGKLHKCHRCGMNFPDKYSYNVHIKTHRGEKMFKCEICPFTSTTRQHFISHRFTHGEERTFKCDQCQLSFRQKPLLRRHITVYHTPEYRPPASKRKTHTCYHCNKKYANKGNLNRHMSVHKSENEFGIKFPEEKNTQCNGRKNVETAAQESAVTEKFAINSDIRGEILMIPHGEDFIVLQVIETPAQEERQYNYDEY